MISYDLACQNAHRFEVWFRSSADYEDQADRGLVACPHCGSIDVTKAPMAPAVSAKGPRPTEAAAPPKAQGNKVEGGALSPQVQAAMVALAKAQAETIGKSTWVGQDFARQSREMHYGERDEQLIHGRASADEARSLLEEGIGVAPLLIPVVPPDEKN